MPTALMGQAIVMEATSG